MNTHLFYCMGRVNKLAAVIGLAGHNPYFKIPSLCTKDPCDNTNRNSDNNKTRMWIANIFWYQPARYFIRS